MSVRYRRPSQALLRILSANIIRLRKAKGWSQEALADKVGMHRTFIGAIERREQNVTLATVEVLAGGLDVSVIDLLSKPK
jgi:transcriptional regulator with XRE-family HTH domain